VSIGARALTGDDYRGHVFWDTEIFLLPFYVLTWPDAARALLMYRFRTLLLAKCPGLPSCGGNPRNVVIVAVLTDLVFLVCLAEEE
jgi:hypothetical protein